MCKGHNVLDGANGDVSPLYLTILSILPPHHNDSPGLFRLKLQENAKAGSHGKEGMF